jgi:hypothetical protein
MALVDEGRVGGETVWLNLFFLVLTVVAFKQTSIG